jgi:hypothetical protein
MTTDAPCAACAHFAISRTGMVTPYLEATPWPTYFSRTSFRTTTATTAAGRFGERSSMESKSHWARWRSGRGGSPPSTETGSRRSTIATGPDLSQAFEAPGSGVPNHSAGAGERRAVDHSLGYDSTNDPLWHDDDPWPRLPRTDLTISLVLSVESAELARALLTQWMTPTTTVDEIRLAIAALPDDPPGEAEQAQ